MDITHYALTNLSFANIRLLSLVGWSTDPEDKWTYDNVIVNDDIDVYAIYQEFSPLTLDGNGGYFPFSDHESTQIYPYTSETIFDPPLEPKVDDITKKFAGWASTPDAKEPDVLPLTMFVEDVVEKYGDVLYAVYTDKVLVTFNANGGFMMDNPEITTYECTKGRDLECDRRAHSRPEVQPHAGVVQLLRKQLFHIG